MFRALRPRRTWNLPPPSASQGIIKSIQDHQPVRQQQRTSKGRELRQTEELGSEYAVTWAALGYSNVAIDFIRRIIITKKSIPIEFTCSSNQEDKSRAAKKIQKATSRD